MAAEATTCSRERIGVVTGANKGIGFEICKQLACEGKIKVVLAARDEKRGLEAFQKLQAFGVGDRVVFHQLDVADSASVAAFAQFLQTKFGRLDILVNNAGVPGANIDGAAMRTASQIKDKSKVDWSSIVVETYDTAAAAFQTNYYGVKRTTEALLPLLELSNSPKIVNVSSTMGMLKNIPHEWAKGILSDRDNLTEEKLDEVVDKYLADSREGSTRERGWPVNSGSYMVSKAILIAYTRLLAKKHPSWKINAVCPGYTKTELNGNSGFLTVEEGAESPVRLALLPDDGPSGMFFSRKEVSEF